MADKDKSNGSNQSELPRLVAQRNAAFAASLLMAAVVVCAGWALEVFPKRNAEVYRSQDAALLSQYNSMQRALTDTQGALRQAQAALLQTEVALRNTQQALKGNPSTPR
jgi:hypothetical protein